MAVLGGLSSTQFPARINKIDGLFKSLSGLLALSCSNPFAPYGPVNGEAASLEILLFGEKEKNERAVVEADV